MFMRITFKYDKCLLQMFSENKEFITNILT